MTFRKSDPPQRPAASHGSDGRVYLVGAGPGDPGLLTLRGLELLGSADLLLYDYLVNPQLLRYVAGSAEQVCLGRHGHGRIMPPEEVHLRMIEAARAGRAVVRLKSGDPMVFGRVAEEIAALNKAGVDFEIVPGVTSALAIGSYAGVPLTSRDAASAVALITGQQQSGSDVESLDFAALARFPGTLVFYMGVTTAPDWSSELMRHGMASDTPAVIVRRCSFTDQETIHCTLGNVAQEIQARSLRPPAVIAVGEAVATAAVPSWFEQRPLFGRRILLTRPSDERSCELATWFSQLGADVLEQPAIRIDPPADWEPVDRAIQDIDRYDWLVFSSRNGVEYFLDRLLQRGFDMRRVAGAKLAAIGPATASALGEFHLRADVVPDTFRAEALAESLAPHVAGRRVLLLRASRGREVLAEMLGDAGTAIEQVVVYSSVDVTERDDEVTEKLAAGEIDYVTVTSSAIARSLVSLFGVDLKKSRLACISPVTAATLRELGHEPAIVAKRYTMAGVVDAILADATAASS